MDLIVNVCENWGIGKDGNLLVSISADLKRFRQLTIGKTVILGRKTLATFPGGKPLDGRTNLVLSNSGVQVAGAEVFSDLSALFERLKNCDLSQVSVIGGASVYKTLLPFCNKAYITKTYLTPDADVFFPNLDEMNNWVVNKMEPMLIDERNIRFQFVDYENQKPRPLEGGLFWR